MLKDELTCSHFCKRKIGSLVFLLGYHMTFGLFYFKEILYNAKEKQVLCVSVISE